MKNLLCPDNKVWDLPDQPLAHGQDNQDAGAADQIPAKNSNEQVFGGGCCVVKLQGLHRNLLEKRGSEALLLY